MTARRDARAKLPAMTRIDQAQQPGIPAALLVGRCIEVWAARDAESPAISAKRRFDLVRKDWGDRAGLDDAELRQLLPTRGPWSAEFLVSEGRGDDALERFAAAGCTFEDVADLRAQARRLVLSAGP